MAASQPTSIRVIGDLVGNGGLTLGVGAGAGQGGGAIYLVSLNSCGCEVERVCSPASPNSGSTAGSRIELVSSASLSLDALDLVATQLPVNQFALFFHGTGSTLVPFGNGVLCATPPFVRLPPPIQSGPTGTVSSTFHPASAGLSVGDVRVVRFCQRWNAPTANIRLCRRRWRW